MTARNRPHYPRLILAVGAWLPQLLPELALPLRVERQIAYWFKVLDAANYSALQTIPIYIVEYAPGRWLYGPLWP